MNSASRSLTIHDGARPVLLATLLCAIAACAHSASSASEGKQTPWAKPKPIPTLASSGRQFPLIDLPRERNGWVLDIDHAAVGTLQPDGLFVAAVPMRDSKSGHSYDVAIFALRGGRPEFLTSISKTEYVDVTIDNTGFYDLHIAAGKLSVSLPEDIAERGHVESTYGLRHGILVTIADEVVAATKPTASPLLPTGPMTPVDAPRVGPTGPMTPVDAPRGGPTGPMTPIDVPISNGNCDDDAIQTVGHDGEILVMMTGAVYKVDASDVSTSAIWLSTDDVLICDDKIVNKDENGESVDAHRVR